MTRLNDGTGLTDGTGTVLDFAGLQPRPAQTWGDVALIPLVRAEPIRDLRLDARAVGAVRAVPAPDGSYLVGYVPHAYVATWTPDGTPAASYGTQLLDPRRPPATAEPTRGLVKRVRSAADDAARLRFLPLVLALDGLLGLEFGGPSIAWAELSRRVVRQGLSPRCEASIRGSDVAGLADALRTFEICAGQCGLLLYVAGQLISAFVVPHPADYRALHASLLLDLYGDVLRELPSQGGRWEPNRAGAGTAGAGDHGLALPAVDSLSALRAALARATDSWAASAAETWLGPDLFGDTLTFAPAYRMGRYRLARFLPSFDRHRDNHLGEAIFGPQGALAYLHTYRLSMTQVRRGRMLRALRAADWDLDATAAGLGVDRAGLMVQLDAIGLAGIVRPDLAAAWRAARRRPTA